MRPIRFLLFSFILALSSFVGASAAAAQTALPPSLQGESFVGTTVTGSVNCPSGGVGDVTTSSIHAEGLAVGPYSGTFTEDVKVTVEQVGVGFHQELIDIVATFTIRDLTGAVVVTGTKKLVRPRLLSGSICVSFLPFLEQIHAFGALTYEATIRSGGRVYRDTGDAFIRSTYTATSSAGSSFTENFTLSRGVLPLDTTGKATGGGQLGDLFSPEHVSFGFEVKQPELGKLQGRCLVNDSAANTRVKCLNVANYFQVGNTATWDGQAEVNGVVEDYQMTVQDNGEPNQAIDTFSIKTDTYEAAGNVQHGNVQLHKQELLP
jgi:hypothetical protein